MKSKVFVFHLVFFPILLLTLKGQNFPLSEGQEITAKCFAFQVFYIPSVTPLKQDSKKENCKITLK